MVSRTDLVLCRTSLSFVVHQIISMTLRMSFRAPVTNRSRGSIIVHSITIIAVVDYSAGIFYHFLEFIGNGNNNTTIDIRDEKSLL